MLYVTKQADVCADDNTNTLLNGQVGTQMTTLKSHRQSRPTLNSVCLFKTFNKQSLTSLQKSGVFAQELKVFLWLADGKTSVEIPQELQVFLPAHRYIATLQGTAEHWTLA